MSTSNQAGRRDKTKAKIVVYLCNKYCILCKYIPIYVYVRICGLYSVGKLEKGRGINRADELCLFFFATIWTEMPTCCLG